jgi:methyltransferase (TIGR00027 family)
MLEKHDATDQGISKQTSTHSVTALYVAQGLACNESLNQLVDPEVLRITKHFLEIAKPQYPMSLMYASLRFFDPLPGRARILFQDIWAKHYVEQIALRKIYIRQSVENAITEKGVQQVLYLGGGFDAMCLVLHKRYPLIKFFELDRGPHREIKENASRTMMEINDNMHFIDADLASNEWLDNLLANGFNLDEPTICIAEGFTMYLTRPALDQWMDKIKICLKHDRSSLLLSFATPALNINQLASALDKRALKGVEENLRSIFQPDAIPDYLKQVNFIATEKFTAPEMQRLISSALGEDFPSKYLGEDYYHLQAVSREYFLTHEALDEKAIPMADIKLEETAFTSPAEEEKSQCIMM